MLIIMMARVQGMLTNRLLVVVVVVYSPQRVKGGGRPVRQRGSFLLERGESRRAPTSPHIIFTIDDQFKPNFLLRNP